MITTYHTVLWLLLTAVVNGRTVAASVPENLALSKSYTLDPAPNYALCTDPGDATQLTDGQYTAGYFWAQKSTVGWSGANPIIVTLDLGQVQPISGVAWSTAAGVAGVEWPRAIFILVSDDGKSYYQAGELVSLSARNSLPPRDGYSLRRFTATQLQTHGRFVKLVVAPSGAYCFVDEIEVFKGESAWTNLPLAGEPIADAKAFFQATAVWTAIQRRFRDDTAAVQDAADKANPPAPAKLEIAALLDSVTRELASLSHKPAPDFRSVLPLNPQHERIFQAQAALWRAQGARPLAVWSCGLWDPLAHIGPIGPGEVSSPELKVAMMQNEYRATAFNLSLSENHPVDLHLKIMGFPGRGPVPSFISVHEVVWTDTREGRPVAAALPLAQSTPDGCVIHLVPGLTRQVWLTFHPTSLPPGNYQGTILLSADKHTIKVPLALRLFPLRFPDVPTLHVGGWDYTDVDAQYEITPRNRDAVIAHLRSHFVDSPWGTAAVLPFGAFDENTGVTADPDTQAFDRWLQRWPGARQYCVFAAVSDRLGDSPMATPLFEKKVAAWVRFWADHSQRRGLEPRQLALLLVDEPSEPKQDAVILAWAKAIRAAGTGIKIWEDTCHADPAAANQEMIQTCHVLCPNRAAFLEAKPAFRNYYVDARNRGAELAFYSCSGPARLLDPYSYYRLQAWSCWQYQAQSSYFWAFGDSGGGSSWNEYAMPRAAYVPFFLDATSVTPGKHMEALREGVEDYEYWVMLKRRVDELDSTGAHPAALPRARALLAEGPQRVCADRAAAALQWRDPKNRALADQVRFEILETLAALK